jgi:hypothetical protein
VVLARVHNQDYGHDHGPDVRLDPTTGGEFTDRLVAKFGLPVAGWRGHRV